MRSLVLLSAAAASAGALILSAPALASSAGAGGAGASRGAGAPGTFARDTPPSKSTSFAGYSYQVENFPSFTVTSHFVVPRLKCSGTTERAITPSVGMLSKAGAKSTIASLFVGCFKGKPDYFPTVVVNGSNHNYDTIHAKPGDKIILTAAESSHGTTVSVVDKTHRFRKSIKGPGNKKLSVPWVGDDSWFQSGLLGVPNFGHIRFSSSKLNGEAFGSWGRAQAGSVPVRWDRVRGSTIQIATGALAKNNEAFTTTFKHS